MTKYYCYQVSPEHQESPLDYSEDLYNTISVFGNRDYKERFSYEVAKIMKVLRNDSFLTAIDEANSVQEIRQEFNSWFENFPKELSDGEINHLAFLILDQSSYERIFSLITGKKYQHKNIKGTVQSDWNDAYYRKEDWPSGIEEFEIEYFNTGSEWGIYTGSLHSDQDCQFETSIYVHNSFYEDIRVEIANKLGVSPQDVYLFKFDGWKRSPKYKEIVFD